MISECDRHGIDYCCSDTTTSTETRSINSLPTDVAHGTNESPVQPRKMYIINNYVLICVYI